MTLLMHLIEFNQKLQTIGQMAGITNFSDLSFTILLRCSAEDQVKIVRT